MMDPRNKAEIEERANHMLKIARESHASGDFESSVRQCVRLAELLWVLDPRLTDVEASVRASGLVAGKVDQ